MELKRDFHAIRAWQQARQDAAVSGDAIVPLQCLWDPLALHPTTDHVRQEVTARRAAAPVEDAIEDDTFFTALK